MQILDGATYLSMASQHKHIPVRPPWMAEMQRMQEHILCQKKTACEQTVKLNSGAYLSLGTGSFAICSHRLEAVKQYFQE